MKVCYFGIFDPTYARNRIIIQGLEANDHEVTICRVDPKVDKGISKYFKLYKGYKKLGKTKFDLVIVGFPGHPVVWLAYLLFGKKVCFDMFVSLYNSNLHDRKVYSKFSPRAFKDWILDFVSCHLAGKIFLDTKAQIDYISKLFFVSPKKFIRIYISADEKLFYPRPKPTNSTFLVHFHGSYVPLQGVQYIADAAVILKDEPIRFKFVGAEAMHKDLAKVIEKHKLTNIDCVPRVSFDKVPDEVAKADICLGIFGDTEKAARVIPNKVYEGAAMGMPIITMKSPATLELFTDKENLIMCNAADGADLARAIIMLKNDAKLREKIGKNARELYLKELTPPAIVRDLLNKLQ